VHLSVLDFHHPCPELAVQGAFLGGLLGGSCLDGGFFVLAFHVAKLYDLLLMLGLLLNIFWGCVD
jgi:hypothetical protein